MSGSVFTLSLDPRALPHALTNRSPGFDVCL
jgi:hypothetical protein